MKKMNLLVIDKGQAVSCNSNWWWCVMAIFEVVGRNRYFHWQFCVKVILVCNRLFLL